MNNKTGADMARELTDWVNKHDLDDFKDFAKWLTTREHRTLQQSCMSLFVQCIQHWAELPADGFDARNAATVKLCKQMVDATGDKYDRHLPMI